MAGRKDAMRIEALIIGDEVLDGRVLDTNSHRLAEALGAVGLLIAQRTVITDDIDVIVAEARAIAARGTKLCVVSGGLGPTSDDLTAQAFAQLAGVPLVRDKVQEARIVAMLEARGRVAAENQRAQADRPEGAEVLVNDMGTAPGFALTFGGCRFVSVPGVPREFDHLLERAVLAPMRAEGRAPRAVRGLYLFGVAEGDADRALRDVAPRYPQVRLQFRVRFPEVHVTLHARPEDGGALDAFFHEVHERLGKYAYATRPMTLPEATLEGLQAHKATVAIAESCTGGLMTDMLTDVPGSSSAVHVGITAYANEAKQALLGVQLQTLKDYGAVSEQTVREMAAGVRKLTGSTYGMAVSGIAGPGGGSANKPVGTIWCGLAWEGETRAVKVVLPYDRRQNKVMAAYVAFNMLRTRLGNVGSLATMA